MNLFLLLKPGHQSYGFTPVLWVVVVVIIGWIAWPVVGPFVSWFLLAVGGVK